MGKSKVNVDELITLYIDEEKTVKETAEIMNINVSAVCYWLNRLKARKIDIWKRKPVEIMTRYQEGQTAKQIAAELETTEARVRYCIKNSAYRKRERPSEKKWKEIISAYVEDENATVKEIAVRYGVTRVVLTKELVARGVFRERNKLAAVSDDEIRTLYFEQGLSMADIAERYEVYHSAVRNRLQKMGILPPPRKRQRAA